DPASASHSGQQLDSGLSLSYHGRRVRPAAARVLAPEGCATLPDMIRPIALVGLMGGGKSAVAALLGARLGGRVVDLDARIEADAGCSVGEIFAREGEVGFRARETAQLKAILQDPPAVLACGGGVVLDPERRALL